MKALTIAAVELRRLLRWRANVFFLFVLPMLIILLLGAAFGGSNEARIGVVGGQGGPLARQFVSALDRRPSTVLSTYATRAELQRAVARGKIDAGLVLPGDYDARVAAGRAARVGWFARPDSVAQQLRTTIDSVATEQAQALVVAGLIQRADGESFSRALARARATAAAVPPATVHVSAPDGGAYAGTESRFESGASTQLLLFIFLNSLNGAVWLIETRRLGVARRMLSTPTSTRTILAGEVLGRFAIALIQALIIIVGTALAFGVSWGNPLGTAAIVVAFSLVGTGAGVLLGSLFGDTEQAGPVALLLGLGLAALGGSMAPLEVFPDTARTIAHVTPHAWANDAFSELLRHGGDLASVLTDVAVLLAFAGALLVLATWRLRRAIVG
jgi:ABC-2 type transport system permease protein